MTIADLLAQHLVGRHIILHDYSLIEGLVPEHYKIETKRELLVVAVDLSDNNVVLTLDDSGEVFHHAMTSIDYLFIKLKPR